MIVANKADILKKCAKKHNVSSKLLSQVFEMERAHLRPGESEKQYRQEEILELLRSRAEDESEVDES